MTRREVMRHVYEKTKGRCWYCGSFHRPFDSWQIEHQNPRIRGGSDEPENLVLACQSCNVAKGKKTVEEYRASLRAKIENRITSARELLDEIESLVGWEKRDGSEGVILYPPDWLMSIDGLLCDAVNKTINCRFAFYGETLGDPVLSYNQNPVIETESVT